MNELTKKKLFLQLQFSTLLLVCSLLPDFGSMFGSAVGSALSSAMGDGAGVLGFLGGPSLIIVIVRLLGLAFGGMALYKFYNDNKNLPMPFLCAMGGGLAVTLITLIPGVPIWLDYVALIALLVGMYLSKDSLGVNWKMLSSQGAYMILLACLLHCYYGIDPKVSTSIAALVGLVMYLIGLGKLKQSLDAEGITGASRLKIAVWLGIAAAIIGIIPLLGTIVGGVVGIIAFVLEFMGYCSLMKSDPIHQEGRDGARKLRLSMIIMMIATFIGFFPMMGIVAAILSLLALWFIYQGWTKILFGLEQ